MQFSSMLIDCGCRLGATVALRAVEIQGGDGVLTESTLEGDAAIDTVGSVRAHESIVIFLPRTTSGKGC
jgi:hypothetical protein